MTDQTNNQTDSSWIIYYQALESGFRYYARSGSDVKFLNEQTLTHCVFQIAPTIVMPCFYLNGDFLTYLPTETNAQRKRVKMSSLINRGYVIYLV